MENIELNIVFLGDIVGRSGREAVKDQIAKIKSKYNPDFIIANGENMAGGAGVEEKTAKEIYNCGVNFLTNGNHIWNKREIFPFLEKNRERIIRPYNYANLPNGDKTPGHGTAIVEVKGLKIGIASLIGRVFMPDLVDCPFHAADRILKNEFSNCDLIFIDFHAEATSEKYAFARYLDGRVNLVVGTHTHVQTADEQIFDKGTGFICDLGMCGAINSVIGVDSAPVISRFLTGFPHRFNSATGASMVNGLAINYSSSSNSEESLISKRFFISNIERINLR